MTHVEMLDMESSDNYVADMKSAKELQVIGKRKKELAKLRTDLERQMYNLKQEESELAIAERTLARLLGIELEPEIEDDIETLHARLNGRRAKPRKTPSIHEMAASLFKETGQEWLETMDIVRLIKTRWWPSAERNDIAPTLWRLHKDGKLRKDGPKYALPKTQEPPKAKA